MRQLLRSSFDFGTFMKRKAALETFCSLITAWFLEDACRFLGMSWVLTIHLRRYHDSRSVRSFDA